MNEETMAAREHSSNPVVSEALEAQLQLLSKRSATCTDAHALAALSREMQNIAILLTGVRRLDLHRMGYR